MTKKYLIYICLMMLLSACGVTRHTPSGMYLLDKNKVEIPKDPNLTKDERITSDELERFVKQSPNKRLFGLNIYLWIYNQAKPNSNTWWNRLKRRIGEPPIYLDTMLTKQSARSMGIYMSGKGFLESKVSYALDTAHKKATVVYTAVQNDPYRINKISYQFRDDFLRPLIMNDTAARLVQPGSIFDISTLDKERARISEFLRERGYYNFSVNNISYVADSTIGHHRVNLTMVVRRYLAGYSADGTPIMENSRIYRIKEVLIQPNFNPVAASTDSGYNKQLDTIYYKGLNIIYNQKQHVRSEILRRIINIYPNYLYNTSDVKRTYDNIMRLGYYKSASILFTESIDSTAADNLVTYIGATNTGAPSKDSTISSTTEGYLTCNILGTPALRQSYTVELEGTTSSNYNGIIAKLSYQNRNLFKGLELFDISLRGGYEFMRVKNKKNSFEIGGGISFSFPRFITPVNVDPHNKMYNPRTKIEFSYNVQQRPYYHRALSSAAWGYSWAGNKNASFILKPIDISIVSLRSIDSAFLASLENPYLQHSYESQLIAGISGSFIFNNQLQSVNKNSTTFRLNLETTGNLISGLTSLFGVKETDDEYRRILGIRFAQYARADANVVRRWATGVKTSLVYRFNIGAGYSYGNSTTLPFERWFYCGGSNSMRGWIARTLGPGSAPLPASSLYPTQLANFKLETNLEFRFPIWGFVHGATFLDVGNIWFLHAGESVPAGVFQFNNFYTQLGANTGLGIRLDFNFFIFRLDWGIKIHNPNEPIGERWNSGFKLNNTALHFGVGYPF